MNPDFNSEPILIPLSKVKLILLFAGAALFVALGIWFVTNPSTFARDIFRFMGNTGVIIVGWMSIAFFGACALMIFRKLFDNKSGLIISNEGITDNSSGVSAGLIVWQDIDGLAVQQVYSQKFILLMVKNPEEYIERYATAFKRKAAKLNYQMYGSPITITANSLKCDFEELNRLLTETLQKHKAN